MKFNELSIDDKFKFNNSIYKRIPDIKASCCKIKANCENINTKEQILIKPLDEVEKLEQ